MENTNPLQRYFRQPAIYIKLPSGGNHYPAGCLNMPPNEELPVYAMTAMDEITYRTADALFNGSAVVNVIKSCIPNILDPWKMPAVDLDAVLVAIRIASYGHELELESVCPHCKEENDYAIDLRVVLEQIKMPDFKQTLKIGDIEIFFKPLSYEQQNDNSVKQFEDQKILQAIPDADLPDNEKLELINSALVKLGQMTLDSLGQSIYMIKADNDVVTEAAHIREFLANCDRQIFNAVRDKLIEYKEEVTLQPLDVNCNSCNKPYTTPFTLDVSNFFASDS